MHRKEFINIDDLATYKRPRVKLHAQRIVLRDEVEGSIIKTKKQQVCRAGEFLVAEIDAKVGGFGIVSDVLDGAIVSSHYFLFDSNEQKLDRRFLDAYAKTLSFQEQVAAQGSTNDAAIRPDHVLAYTIPLPPLPEQRRIVARIEELAGKIGTAVNERLAPEGDLMSGVERQIWPDDVLAESPTLASVTEFLARGRQSEQRESAHYLIKTQHVQMGRYVRTMLTLAPHVAARVLPEAHARAGDVLIASSAAGCLGRVAFSGGENVVASTDTHVAIARANRSRVLPEYLYAYLKSAQGQYQLRSRERGDWTKEKIGFRLTELNLRHLMEVPVPCPSLAEQRRIVDQLYALQAKVDELKRLQAETQAELDALMPSILDRAFKGGL